MMVTIKLEKDQDVPEKIRNDLQAEFDIAVLDRETTAQKLRSRVCLPGESLAQFVL